MLKNFVNHQFLMKFGIISVNNGLPNINLISQNLHKKYRVFALKIETSDIVQKLRAKWDHFASFFV